MLSRRVGTPSFSLLRRIPLCQGGVRWGQWEEGIAGTIIKDTWTKSGGMVGVGEGGGFSWGGGREGEKRHTTVIE